MFLIGKRYGEFQGGMRLKVAIVGNGNIYNLAHMHAWRALNLKNKDIEVVATCDIVEERAKKACKDVAAKKYYTNMDDLLSNDGIDVIDLCVPTYEHARLSIDALKAGKAVICEKPMARRLKEAEEMLKAAERSGKGLYIAHTRRFDRRWRIIKDNLKKVGEPMYIRRCERSWLPFPQDYWYWDFDKSGGVLLDVGIHCVDLVTWFFECSPTEVFAKGKMIRGEAKANETYDLATILIKFEGGRTAFIDVSWAFSRSYAPFYSSLDVVGTEGRLEYHDKNTNPMVFVRDKIEFPRYSTLLSSSLDAFEEEMEEFVRCLTTDKKPVVTMGDAYNTLKVILKAEESIRKGKHVKFKS